MKRKVPGNSTDRYLATQCEKSRFTSIGAITPSSAHSPPIHHQRHLFATTLISCDRFVSSQVSGFTTTLDGVPHHGQPLELLEASPSRTLRCINTHQSERNRNLILRKSIKMEEDLIQKFKFAQAPTFRALGSSVTPAKHAPLTTPAIPGSAVNVRMPFVPGSSCTQDARAPFEINGRQSAQGAQNVLSSAEDSGRMSLWTEDGKDVAAETVNDGKEEMEDEVSNHLDSVSTAC